jgi:hypothetical protein
MDHCEWGHDDCKNLGEKCYLCVTRDYHYDPVVSRRPKPLAKRQQRADKRMGSHFEYKNHVRNSNILSDVSSRMTPNSGAGSVKGDEEITGIINIMEELKTKVKEQAPGKQSFTIKREWLEKLHREALAANKEFWYLKFSFHEYDQDVYVIVEQDIIMSMVKTMVEDRKAVREAELKQEIAEKERRLYEAENIKLQAEIDLLKAKLKLREVNEGADSKDKTNGLIHDS